MKKIFLLTLIFLKNLLSEDIEASNEATSLYLANINALMIFTSQNNVGSGKYNFSNIDTHMVVLHAPIRYHIPSKKDESNFFLTGNAGYSQTDGALNLPIQERSTESDAEVEVKPLLSTYTGGIGGGWRYKITPHSSILIGGEFIYSRVGVVLRTENDSDFEFVKEFFSQTFNDNLSFKGLLEYNYTRNYRDYIINAKMGFRYFNTSSELNIKEALSSIYTIRSQSYLTQLRVGVETPPLFTFYQWPLTLKFFTEGDLLFGDVSRILKVDSYALVGMDTFLYTKKHNWGITRFFIEGSALNGYGIHGYNVGLGFNVGF